MVSSKNKVESWQLERVEGGGLHVWRDLVEQWCNGGEEVAPPQEGSAPPYTSLHHGEDYNMHHGALW